MSSQGTKASNPKHDPHSQAGSGRAHGKVILLGEHAVVYGVPALATGIDRGARAVAQASPAPSFTINGTSAEGELAEQALSALHTALGSELLSVTAELDLPPGSGLGASAALGVAIAKAVLGHAGHGDAPEDVLKGAAAWERVFHGNPSGIDMTASYYGGTFKYCREKPTEFLRVPVPLRLAVAKAGPPASTKSMVEHVAKLKQRRPELFEKSMEGVRSLVENAALCLKAGDLQGLGKLMDYNQMLLSGLFLSTPEIEDACGIARAAGALGAKLTGAGGGGAVIALGPDPDQIVAAWTARGISAFVAICGATTDPAPSREPEPSSEPSTGSTP